jgi:hypothetical protein
MPDHDPFSDPDRLVAIVRRARGAGNGGGWDRADWHQSPTAAARPIHLILRWLSTKSLLTPAGQAELSRAERGDLTSLHLAPALVVAAAHAFLSREYDRWYEDQGVNYVLDPCLAFDVGELDRLWHSAGVRHGRAAPVRPRTVLPLPTEVRTLGYSSPADERALQRELRHAPRNGVEAYNDATFGSRHPYRGVLVRTGICLVIAVPLAAILPRYIVGLIALAMVVAVNVVLMRRELQKLANPERPLRRMPQPGKPGPGPSHQGLP